MDIREKLYYDQCKRTENWAYAYGRLRGMLMTDLSRSSELAEIDEELQRNLKSAEEEK